jgi:hypothetical protein
VSPNSITPEDVNVFLGYLAVERRVAASAQNQAFNALHFVFRHILHKDFGEHRIHQLQAVAPTVRIILSTHTRGITL